eukprot:TRINITY_DN4812_c0_g1_i2.p1 TRINITY_DN4812_c0_g1~~TRINITY_DN4812_c0_g1_i2.p1  ORF type:complete len:318 (-),score=53.35 TRINITY_DN4812_c0_g1_i2:144-1097(-)
MKQELPMENDTHYPFRVKIDQEHILKRTFNSPVKKESAMMNTQPDDALPSRIVVTSISHDDQENAQVVPSEVNEKIVAEHSSDESCLASDLTKFIISAGWGFHDVEFNVQGALIQGHRVILACRSQYFNALFLNYIKENGDAPILKIEVDVELDVFQSCYDYIYSDKFSLPTEVDNTGPISELKVWKCWMAANYFSLESYLQKIEKHISENVLDNENLCVFWNFLHKNYCGKAVHNLRKICCKFFQKNLVHFVVGNLHLELERELMIEAFNDPSFESTYKTMAMTRWIAHRNPDIVKRKIQSLSNFEVRKKRRIDNT